MNLGVIELTIILDSGMLAINKYVSINTSSGGVARIYTITGKLMSMTGEAATDALGKLKVYVPKNAEYSIFVRNNKRQRSFLYSKFNIVPVPIIEGSDSNNILVSDNTEVVKTSHSGLVSSIPIDIDLTASNLYGLPIWIKLNPDTDCSLKLECSYDYKLSWSTQSGYIHRTVMYQYMKQAGESWMTNLKISHATNLVGNSTWAIWS